MTFVVGWAASTESIVSTRAELFSNRTARRTISGCPTTIGRQQACTLGSFQAPTTVSGPTPSGSPSVMAIVGLVMAQF